MRASDDESYSVFNAAKHLPQGVCVRVATPPCQHPQRFVPWTACKYVHRKYVRLYAMCFSSKCCHFVFECVIQVVICLSFVGA